MAGAQIKTSAHNMSNIVPVGYPDLDSNEVTPKYRPGSYSFMVDDFGPRIFQYMQVTQSGGMTVGQLSSMKAQSGTITATSGSITSAADSAQTWTADEWVGSVVYVLDNNDSAGAAPESQVGICVGNTTTTLNIDPDRPFTAAVAVSDTFIAKPMYQIEDSADGDLNTEIAGVVMAPNGVTADSYGWIQVEGFCPKVAVKATTTIGVNTYAVADTASVNLPGSDATSLSVGYYPFAATNDIDADFIPIVLTLFSQRGISIIAT